MIINRYTNDENGFIEVSNNGAFYGGFRVSYFINNKFFKIESPRMAISTSYKIEIPNNATSITFTGLCYMTFTKTRPICRKYFIVPPKECYYLWGTIFYGGCTKTDCNSLKNCTL